MKERLLELLENEFSALDIMTINDKLGCTTVEELQEIEYELDILTKELVVYLTNKNKYILYSKCPDFKKGIMQINKSGNGFVVIEDEPDVFIKEEDLGYALAGDTVLVKITDNHGKKPEGMVIKILKRDINNIVGQIKSDGVSIYFEPQKKLNIKLTVDETSLKKCVEGEIVVVSIVEDLGKNRYIGEVSRHICHKDDANQDILSIAANYEIYPDFPEEAMMQAGSLPDDVSGESLEHELTYRTDLRDENIFTIDGKDTKDIDDAISIKRDGENYNLKVSIADVSFYVGEGTPLDLEAYNRGTSSYLAYAVLPMLPHKLSNGICSLNPNVDRCALTCDMTINKNAKVIDSSIYPSIIRSKKKMNYDDVNSVLEQDIIPEGYEDYADDLKLMQELAHIIRTERTRRGASDFDMDEVKFTCDETGKAVDVHILYRGEGEKLIEDFMVIANETVASTLFNMNLPAIYRVHGTPVAEKVQSFITFLHSFGINVKGKFSDITNPKMFQSLLNQIEIEGQQKNIVFSLALRSLPKAIYSPDNIGHFGLAVVPPHTSYTHFTSPIRRYPDLITHRLIWTYLINNKTDSATLDYYRKELGPITEQASKREQMAVEAERAVTKMKMAEYMEQHIGEEYDGIISGVGTFGIFVQLENLVEGLVSTDLLDGNNFEYVEYACALIDKKTSKTYKLGQNIRVKCISASKATSMVDFALVKDAKDEYNNEATEKKTKRKFKKR
ncbi:MAG: ribonuclease R [Erysipelotrichales bacterium]|nr:ribonuclease R [Erysipelotrichales bacterium]